MSKRVERIVIWIIILIASIIPMIPMLNAGFIKGHDNEFHYAQIRDMYDAWSNGHFNNYLNYETLHYFGIGVKLFYAPLSHFVTVVLGFILGGHLTLAMKLTMYLSVLLSGVFTYIFAKKTTKRELPSIAACLIYMLFPYRFTDLYVRNAYAESIAMLFIPLVFYGVYSILKLSKAKLLPFIITILAASGIVLTHNITAFYTFFFVVIFVLFYYKDLIRLFKTKWFWIYTSVSVLIILALVSPLIVPLLQHKALGIYRIFDGEMMVSNYDKMVAEVKRSTVFLACGINSQAIELFLTIAFEFTALILLFQFRKYVVTKKTSYIILTLLGVLLASFTIIYGLHYNIDDDIHIVFVTINLMAIILIVMPFKDHLSNHQLDLNGAIAFLALSILTIVMIYFDKIWRILPSIFYSIQFPWRLWVFFGFFVAMEICYLISYLTKYFNSLEIKIAASVLAVGVVCFIRPLSVRSYGFSTDYSIKKTDVINFYSTGWNLEYFPLECFDDSPKSNYFYSCRNMWYKSSDPLENYQPVMNVGIMDNNCSVTSYTYNEGVIEFDVVMLNDESSLIELPRIYYLGYEITITDNDGNVHYYDSICSEGLLSFKATTTGHAKIEYKGTKLMNASKVFAVIGVISLVLIPVGFKGFELYKKRKTEE